MTSNNLFRGIAALAGCAALAAPAAALGEGDKGPGPETLERGSRPHAVFVTNIVEGEIASVKRGKRTSSLVVSVEKTNRHARRFLNKKINVDIAHRKYGTRLVTADHNGDGRRNVADLAAGDLVVITNHVPKNFRPPLSSFRMLPQLIVASRPDAEEPAETETTETE